MFNPSTAAFMVEILLAELIFLFPAEKRVHFPVRYSLTFLILTVIGGFFPIQYSAGIAAQFMLFLLLFALSMLGMYVCFSLSPAALIGSCVSGYAVEHIAFHLVKLALAAGFLANVHLQGFEQRTLAEMILFPPAYLVFFLTLGLYARRNEPYRQMPPSFHYLALGIVLMCIGFTRIATYFGDYNSITVSLYAIAACGLALGIQLVLSRTEALRAENDTLRTLWAEDRKQFALSKATMDTINIKYHDLKHTLRAMALPEEEVRAIKDAVRVYGSRVRTGIEPLDVLLGEYSLQCGEKGITLTYTGNGADLSFMQMMDIYSLFGNAVQNAVEAVEQLRNPEKKLIDILSEKRGEMVNIIFTNYFEGARNIVEGIPMTTKTEEKGFHGFGFLSMQRIAEKYGGCLQARCEEDLFILTVYLIADQ